MAIVNISLALSTSTGLQNALQGVIAQGFTLTDYTDGTGTPAISVGRTEEIAGALYRVESSNFTVDVTGVSGDGTYYIYVEDTGVSITAKALSTVPTWRGDLGGYYLSGVSTSKAVFRFVKTGSNYNSKSNIIQTIGYVPSDISVNNITVTSDITVSGDISVDTINEKTTNAGVTIDGVLLKDGAINIDQINEKTASAGVTIDGVLLKDSIVSSGTFTSGTVSLPNGTSNIDFGSFVGLGKKLFIGSIILTATGVSNIINVNTSGYFDANQSLATILSQYNSGLAVQVITINSVSSVPPVTQTFRLNITSTYGSATNISITMKLLYLQ